MSRNPIALPHQPFWFTPHGATWFPADPRRVHVATVPRRPGSRDALLAALARELEVPDGPPRSWDALTLQLRDLRWLGVDDVVIVHRRLPELPNTVLSGYLDALVRAHDGRPSTSPRLAVVFPSRLYADAAALMPP
jgi:hypothetical protein